MNILGFTYNIEINNDHAYGSHTPAQNLIELASYPCKDFQMGVLMHEIFEAINYHLELNLDHPQLTMLGTALYQVLKDNKVNLEPLAKFIPPIETIGGMRE